MKDYKKDLIERIIDLYDMYERYMWKNPEAKLNILIQDNTIAFYLFNDQNELDNIVLTFSGKENSLYKYISIKILLEMIHDVIVHQTENEFHNTVLKPYLKLIVNDENILKIMQNLIDRQLLEHINDNTDVIKNISESIINPIFYPQKVIRQLDMRIGMTRRLLKSGGKI